jgi:hypothetical protein
MLLIHSLLGAYLKSSSLSKKSVGLLWSELMRKGIRVSWRRVEWRKWRDTGPLLLFLCTTTLALRAHARQSWSCHICPPVGSSPARVSFPFLALTFVTLKQRANSLRFLLFLYRFVPSCVLIPFWSYSRHYR